LNGHVIFNSVTLGTFDKQKHIKATFTAFLGLPG